MAVHEAAAAAAGARLLNAQQRTEVAAAAVEAEAAAEAAAAEEAAALGRCGPWQWRTLLLTGLVKVPSAWHMASVLFTAPTPAPHQFWCRRPDSAPALQPARWRNFSHVQFDSCNVYKEAYDMVVNEELIPFDKLNSSIQPCTEFEFNSTITAITQWNLVCQRQVLVSVSQFFYLLGILVGGVLCTKLLARFAPRKLLLAGMLAQILAGTGLAFSISIEMQMFLRFATAASCAHMFTAGYMISTGNSECRTRLIIGSCYEHFWSLGVITLPCIASIFEDWRHLQLAISLPTVFLLLLYCWIPESPLWLSNVGRKEEAKKILENAIQFNGEFLPLAKATIGEVRKSSSSEPQSGDLNIYFYTALHITWAATIVTYYGGLLNVKSIGEHLFLNTGIAGIAEIVGVLLSLFCILKISSKWTILGVINIVGGLLCISSWILPVNDSEIRAWIILLLAMIGRVAIAASLNILTVQCAALLPKSKRHSVMFSAVTIARVCLLSAPFIGSLAAFGDCVPLSVFGALTAIAGFALIPLQNADDLKYLENNNGCNSTIYFGQEESCRFQASRSIKSYEELSTLKQQSKV